MNKEIYYFSGTGNSLIVAKDMADKIGGKLIPVSAVMNQEKIKTDADVIGIVFPIYYIVNTGLPMIISNFAKKLSNIDKKYIFAICTCGGGSSNALSNLNKILKSRGGKLSAGFTIVMQSNASDDKEEKVVKNNAALKPKLASIYEYINSCKEGKIENTHLWARILFTPLVPLMKPLIIGPMEKLAGSKKLPFEQLVYLSDKSYSVDMNCDGCETCAKICPVKNIKIVDKKPVWQHKCETCLACFHWCHKEAIHGGIVPKIKKYHHPDIKLSEMFL